MSRLLHFSFAAAAALLSATAAAEDFYAGATVSKGGELRFANPINQKSSTSDAKASFKVYGGYALSELLAVEAGYTHGGSTRFDKAAIGMTDDATFKISNFYLAGRLNHQFNDEWSVFGKAGVARSRFKASSGGDTDSVSSTKPLLGVGMAYNFTKNAAATLEYEHIGATRKDGINIKQGRLQLGVRFGF